MNVRSDFGGCSATWLRISFVLQMRTLALSPPVAIREPSGAHGRRTLTRAFRPRASQSLCACRSASGEWNGEVLMVSDSERGR